MKKLFTYLEGPKSFLPKWLRESNRAKHFVYALPCGILGGPFFVLGLALGMEFKDRQWGGKFDFLDLLATLLGGIPGSLIWFI